MSLTHSLWSRLLAGGLIAAAGIGCSNMNNTQKGAGLGAAGGAGLGAIVGKQLGNTGAGAAIGAIAGTATGALVGNAKDEADKRDNYARQAAYERSLRTREQRAMSNRDVLDMVAGGSSDHIIVNTIKNRGGRFDTSPQAIVYLQKYGVSDQVIETMQSATY
ncbi:MAG: YMGG-like glycine zipper-containing protein [Planctomycetales bacterium]